MRKHSALPSRSFHLLEVVMKAFWKRRVAILMLACGCILGIGVAATCFYQQQVNVEERLGGEIVSFTVDTDAGIISSNSMARAEEQWLLNHPEREVAARYPIQGGPKERPALVIRTVPRTEKGK